MAAWSIIESSKLEGAKRIDPEYYRPNYMAWADEIRRIGFKELGQLATVAYGTTPEGGVFEETGIPFVRSQAFSSLSVDSSALVFCTDRFHGENRKSEIVPRDILLAAVGANIGELAVVPPRIGKGNINQNVARARLRSSELLPEYVAAFLSTRLGQFQIDRLVTGNAQPYLNSNQIKALRIPKVSFARQQFFTSIFEGIHSKLGESENLYTEAERLLIDEIGFSKIDLSWSPGYVVTSKAACGTNRIDAEHFQPKHARLIQHLEKTGKVCKVGDILRGRIEKGVTPEYTETGVAAINSQHLGRYLLNYEGVDHTPETYWANNKRAQIRNLDVLIYATGAYIGRTNCYLENAKALAGVDILMARPNPKCNPIYLSVYLNSKLGMMQADQWATGSAQRHLYPETIAKFTVYLPSPSFQQKIADLVTAAYEARAKAKKLLEEAKRKVEDLIEHSS